MSNLQKRETQMTKETWWVGNAQTSGIREIQIESIIVYHFTHPGMSKLKSQLMPKLHGSGETGSLWTPGGSVDRYTHAGKQPATLSP